MIAQKTLATVTGPAFDWQIREPSEAAQSQYDEAETAYDAEDYETAAPLYEAACEGGHMKGCRDRGYMAEAALGMEQNYEEARTYYQTSCNGGDAAGCAYLGEVFLEGWGVSKDYDRAIELYTHACENESSYGLSLIHI